MRYITDNIIYNTSLFLLLAIMPRNPRCLSVISRELIFRLIRRIVLSYSANPEPIPNPL